MHRLCLFVLLLAHVTGHAGTVQDEAAGSAAEAPADDPPVAAQRRALELSARNNPYAITPHRPNYLLPLSYSHRPKSELLNLGDRRLDNSEIKFQLSFKLAIWAEPFAQPVDLFFAYTGRSFWQAYNSKLSAPFRDTNHEPEIFLLTHHDWQWGAVSDINLRLGLNHQSNGQSLPLSRSWNRVYAGISGRWRQFFADAVFWQRLPEDPKTSPEDPEGDDNPGIENTVGRAEFTLAWVIQKKTINLNWRNNLRSDLKGGLTGAFTFPLNSRMKGYLEFFTGYGETLLDYNRSNERLSFGIALNDWP